MKIRDLLHAVLLEDRSRAEQRLVFETLDIDLQQIDRRIALEMPKNLSMQIMPGQAEIIRADGARLQIPPTLKAAGAFEQECGPGTQAADSVAPTITAVPCAPDGP